MVRHRTLPSSPRGRLRRESFDANNSISEHLHAARQLGVGVDLSALIESYDDASPVNVDTILRPRSRQQTVHYKRSYGRAKTDTEAIASSQNKAQDNKRRYGSEGQATSLAWQLRTQQRHYSANDSRSYDILPDVTSQNSVNKSHVKSRASGGQGLSQATGKQTSQSLLGSSQADAGESVSVDPVSYGNASFHTLTSVQEDDELNSDFELIVQNANSMTLVQNDEEEIPNERVSLTTEDGALPLADGRSGPSRANTLEEVDSSHKVVAQSASRGELLQHIQKDETDDNTVLDPMVLLDIAASYIDTVRMSNSCKSDVKAWCERNLPVFTGASQTMGQSMGSEKIDPLHQFLIELALKLRSLLKITRGGALLRFFLFLVIYYLDTFSDCIMIYTFYQQKDYGYAIACLACLFVALIWHGYSAFGSKKSLSRGERIWHHALPALLGCSPIMDSLSVLKGDEFDPEKTNLGPNLRLQTTQFIHVVAESLPELMIQMHAALQPGEDYPPDGMSQFSLLLSALTIAQSVADGNIAFELMSSGFWTRFSLYGYIDGNGRRGCRVRRFWFAKGFFRFLFGNEEQTSQGLFSAATMMLYMQMLCSFCFLLLFALAFNATLLYMEFALEWGTRFTFVESLLVILGYHMVFEFLLMYCGAKLWKREMWHPGAVVQHSRWNDYVSGLFGHVQHYIGVAMLFRMASRDPRRAGPRTFAFFFAYRVILFNCVILFVDWRPFSSDFDKTLNSYREGRYTFEQIGLNVGLVIGVLGIAWCSNPLYDKRFLFGLRRCGGRELYDAVFEIVVPEELNTSITNVTTPAPVSRTSSPDSVTRRSTSLLRSSFTGDSMGHLPRVNSSDLSRKFFLEGERANRFTRLATKDEERAFFIRTRHALWIPPDVIERWICEQLRGKYLSGGEKHPPAFLDEKFRDRVRAVLKDYYKRDFEECGDVLLKLIQRRVALNRNSCFVIRQSC